MAAAPQNLALEQGSSWRKQFEWHQAPPEGSPPGTLGDPYDLTGCTAIAQIRTGPGGRLMVELTDGDGITLGGEDGTIAVHITGEKARELTSRRGQWDLYIIFPSGDPVRLLDGKVTIDPTVTQLPEEAAS